MTFTKEEQIQAIYDLKVGYTLGHADIAILKSMARQLLASMEQEPIAWLNDAYLGRGVVDGEAGSEDAGPGYIPVYREPTYTAPPAPVVPDIGEIRVGRLPTMNQEDYPGLGDWWVQLRIGEDSDEVLARVYGATPQEANSRAEALACRAAMLQGAAGNSPAIPDSYDIESFGIFRASEGSSGFIVEIEQFRFGTEKCPQIGKTHMVPKFALQAIINALQQHCDSMEEAPSLAEEVNWEAK